MNEISFEKAPLEMKGSSCSPEGCDKCPFFLNGDCELPRDLIFRVTDDFKPYLKKLKEDKPPDMSFCAFIRYILKTWCDENPYISLDVKKQNARRDIERAQTRLRNIEQVEKELKIAQEQQKLVTLTIEQIIATVEAHVVNRMNTTFTVQSWVQFKLLEPKAVKNYADQCGLTVLIFDQHILKILRNDP